MDTSRSDFQQRLAGAQHARRQVLASHRNDDIVASVARAAALWTDPNSTARRDLAERLAPILRMHPGMLEQGLTNIFGALDADQLHRWIEREVASPERMEPDADAAAANSTQSRRLGMPQRSDATGRLQSEKPPYTRLTGPAVIAHALAGNVPGLAIPAITASLLARSVCVIRDSARQPLVTQAFIDSLGVGDPLLAAMVVPMSWRAGDVAREREVFERCSRVELYGNDHTLATICGRHPAAAVTRHGSRVSVGLVPAAARLEESWADGFALDAVLYDGKGCLSPHFVIVEGDFDRAARAAAQLAEALDRLERRWPRQAQGLAVETVRRAFVDAAELAAARDTARLWRGTHDCWCVRADRVRGPLAPGPGLRCLTVMPSPGPTETRMMLSNTVLPLAGVAVVLTGDQALDESVRAMLAAAGATLVCEPGRLQAPPIGWRLDGRLRLAELLLGLQ